MGALNDLVAIIEEKVDPLDFYRDEAYQVARVFRKCFKQLGRNVGDTVDVMEAVNLRGMAIFKATNVEEIRKNIVDNHNSLENWPKAGIVEKISYGVYRLTEVSKKWYDQLVQAGFYEREDERQKGNFCEKDLTDLTELAQLLMEKLGSLEDIFMSIGYQMAATLHFEFITNENSVGKTFSEIDPDFDFYRVRTYEYMAQAGIVKRICFNCYELTEKSKEWFEKFDTEGFYEHLKEEEEERAHIGSERGSSDIPDEDFPF
ncbi:MAG: hypothetical protein KAT43_01205 [Nanoarchaeota archaeon]|nr:hypothetical protein [Nanoarchaeota archaeon]